MPKYNLIDDLESEEQKPQEPAESVEKKDSPADSDDTKLSEYIVEDIVVSEPEMKPGEDDLIVEKDDSPGDFADQQKFTVPEGTPPMQPYDLGSDYEDEKQPGLNYKPILIGIAAVAAIVIIYFAIDMFFLSGEQTPETEVVVETPAEKMRRVREEQKQNLLLNYSNSNKHRISYLSALIDLNTTDVKYSSFLLYGSSLNFEVFAKNRDKYNLDMTPPAPGATGGPVASTTPSNWVTATTNQFGLNLTSQRQISNRPENIFSISRNEFVFVGSESNCNKLIKHLASQNMNLNTHKLMLLPRDQRLMSKAAYELRLIIDFYL